MITHREVLDVVSGIEAMGATTKYRYRDINLWPLLRYLIAHHSFNPSSEKKKTFQKKPLLLLGARLCFSGCLALFEIPRLVWSLFFLKAPYVFFSREEENKFVSDSKMGNPLAEGWKAEMDFFGKSQVIYCEKLKYKNMERFLVDIFRYRFEKEKFFSNLNFEDLRFKYPQLQWTSIQEDMLSAFVRIYSKYICFSLFLKLIKPSAVFYSVFYASESFALALACVRLGVKSVEVQHGLDGKGNVFETEFSSIPKEGYELLPRYFWVWSEASFKLKKCFFNSRHRVFVAGYPQRHVRMASEATATSEILYAIQPVDDPLPKFLHHFMLSEEGAFYKWNLRLHPRMMSDLQRYCDVYEGYSHIEVAKATRSSLSSMLCRCDAVVSKWSTVLVEGLSFRKKAIVISENGKSLFEEEIRSGIMLYADTAEGLRLSLRASNRMDIANPILFETDSKIIRDNIQTMLLDKQQNQN